MAFVLVWAGVLIKEKVEDRKERKRMKQVNIDRKYKELQEETKRRLSATGSGGGSPVEDGDEGSRRTSEEVRREEAEVARREMEEREARARRNHLNRILG
jgi:hypothetical protein